LATILAGLFRSRRHLLLENLALWQQLSVFKQKNPQPRLAPFDKLFWVMLSRLWADWRRGSMLVQPNTVIRWHRQALSCIGHGFQGTEQMREENV
jgi:hypothetical protein